MTFNLFKNLKLKTKNCHKKNGFTLLLSLLVISVILSVGFGVFDVMTKELKLSGLGRESQIAFYAADAGIECAYFWDIKHPGFTESAFDSNGDVNIKCGGGGLENGIETTYGAESGHSFNFNMGDLTTQKCAKVTVTKTIKEEGEFKTTITTIQSKGYNYYCESTSLHKVERAIKVISTKTEKVE